jgi:Questin oxidase-like
MTQRNNEPAIGRSDAEIFDLPPETTAGLTFHLPMEIVALCDAGAPSETIEQRKQERLHDAQAEGLADPPLYRWAIRRYTDTAQRLLSGNDHAAAREIEPLAEGLAGAAFHGLIRLGYGAWQRDEAEIARGLAYLRTRRQVLASPSNSPSNSPANSPSNSPSTLGETDNTELANRSDLPSPHERDGVTVFDLLNLAAGTGLCGSPDAQVADTPRALALAAMALVRRNPSSFVAVHAATGFHALCEVELLLSGSAPSPNEAPTTNTNAWWSAYGIALQACTLLVASGPPEALPGYDDRYGVVTDIESLVTASTRSADTHDVKLAVSLRRLVHFGLLTDTEATEVGIARLAAEQLT